VSNFSSSFDSQTNELIQKKNVKWIAFSLRSLCNMRVDLYCIDRFYTREMFSFTNHSRLTHTHTLKLSLILFWGFIIQHSSDYESIAFINWFSLLSLFQFKTMSVVFLLVSLSASHSLIIRFFSHYQLLLEIVAELQLQNEPSHNYKFAFNKRNKELLI
jgi:hypothetical protein